MPRKKSILTSEASGVSTWAYLLIVLAVLLLLSAGFWLWSTRKEQRDRARALTSSYTAYSHPTLGVSLRYPSILEVIEGPQEVRFRGTTSTVGDYPLELAISRESFQGSFESAVEMDLQASRVGGLETTSSSSLTLDGIPGRAYQTKNTTRRTTILLPIARAEWIRISYTLPSSPPSDLEQAVYAMLYTLTFGESPPSS